MLFVIENSVYGGGEKTFSLLIRRLPSEKFEIYCASLPRGRFFEEVKDHCRFLPLDLTNRYDLRNIGRLRKIMTENGVAIAHSQGTRADFYCGLAASKAGIKAAATVAMPVEGFDVGFLRKKLYVLLNSFAVRELSAVITVSEALAVFLRGRHGRVEVIPNPVDLGEFDPSNFNAAPVIERFGLRGKIVLGALGRLEWQKGYSRLISAVGLVLRKQPALKEKLVCLVAGSGRLGDGLKRQAADAGLSANINFCGDIMEVRDFLAAIDIFVMPSLLEGQPLALLEAMAMAKPIAASDIPGINGTVQNRETALLVRPDDETALAEGLIELIQDRSFARRLGLGARGKAGAFGLPVFIERHCAFYEGLAGRAGKGPAA